MISTCSPSRSTRTVQRFSASDQSAAITFWPYRMCLSIPDSATVSFRYDMMDGPSAMAFSDVHGLNRKPRVNMSESDRMPG